MAHLNAEPKIGRASVFSEGSHEPMAPLISYPQGEASCFKFSPAKFGLPS
jgi:hypothetical protein